jgi:DNA repair exonuclease SbcCD ATPase subunit
VIQEAPQFHDTDRQLEADIIARLRDGEGPMDIVESGSASLEEVTRVLDDLSELEGLKVVETQELEERKAEAFKRGKRSRDDEVDTLEAQIQNLRRQLNESNSTIQRLEQQCERLYQQTHRQSEQITDLEDKKQRVDELERDLELERDKRKRAEQKFEAFKESVEDEMNEIRGLHRENQQELEQKKRELRKKDRRISDLEELLVDDIATVAATVRAVRRPGVGLGATHTLQ